MQQQYTIQMVSRLTGLTIHTLRAWEKRYQTVVPLRDDSGRRVYSEEDLTKLKLLTQVCSYGANIGSYAHRSREELKQYLNKFENENKLPSLDHPIHTEETPKKKEFLKNLENYLPKSQNISSSYTTENEKITTSHVDTHTSTQYLIIALENYKLDVISHELSKLKIALNSKDMVFKIILPLLKEIGFRVNNKSLNIAQEHALSSILKYHLGSYIFNNYEKKENNKIGRILLATPEGEHHEFGILLSAMLCAYYGLDFLYLGTNLPSESFIQAALSLNSKILILGTSQSYHQSQGRDSLNTYLDQVLEKIQDDTMLCLGGQGLFDLMTFNKHKNFHFISTLEHLDQYLQHVAHLS